MVENSCANILTVFTPCPGHQTLPGSLESIPDTIIFYDINCIHLFETVFNDVLEHELLEQNISFNFDKKTHQFLLDLYSCSMSLMQFVNQTNNCKCILFASYLHFS
jgi:hypothetical protein